MCQLYEVIPYADWGYKGELTAAAAAAVVPGQSVQLRSRPADSRRTEDRRRAKGGQTYY